MALALNNLKKVDMPLNKETKPNQTNQIFMILVSVLTDLNNVSSDFQFFQYFFQACRDRSKCAIYNWYHIHPHFPQVFY